MHERTSGSSKLHLKQYVTKVQVNTTRLTVRILRLKPSTTNEIAAPLCQTAPRIVWHFRFSVSEEDSGAIDSVAAFHRPTMMHGYDVGALAQMSAPRDDSSHNAKMIFRPTRIIVASAIIQRPPVQANQMVTS